MRARMQAYWDQTNVFLSVEKDGESYFCSTSRPWFPITLVCEPSLRVAHVNLAC